jgi:hypothetical protein
MIIPHRLPLGRYKTATPGFVISELNAIGFLQNCSTIVDGHVAKNLAQFVTPLNNVTLRN